MSLIRFNFGIHDPAWISDKMNDFNIEIDYYILQIRDVTYANSFDRHTTVSSTDWAKY